MKAPRSRGRVSTGSPPADGGDSRLQRDSYHHGNLRAALIADAIEVISERGAGGYSLAEASRRLGVAVSAPYAHFADRAELLAAVCVHALEIFRDELEPRLARSAAPADRLATTARGYVQFAASHKELFQLLFSAEFGALDKARHPEIAAAERPIEEAFLDSVKALTPTGDRVMAEAVAAAVEAIAHGHAMLLLDGRFGTGSRAAGRAATSAARATLALLDGSDRFLSPRRTRKS
ncbi:TetR/AcrR family transcriptional regulator [Kribbella sp. NPDC049584]|uniref:TetR/AcrR family transcriptional regulator n=1 Tax=Kribbella sp. NPDC049584 TaxID=3154833 RepID=UPI003433E438